MNSLQKEIEQKLSEVPVVGPYKKHKLNLSPIINLSDNLNHPLGHDCYPPFESKKLNDIYTNILIEDDPNLSFIHSKEVDLFFINGALEAIRLILQMLQTPKRTALTFVPTFPFYRDICGRMGMKFDEVPLEGNMLDMLNLEVVASLSPGIIILCDPNNPVSTRFSPCHIEKLLSSFPETWVIIDEAYIDFSDRPSNLRFLSKYNNLIVVRGLSKGWGMASLRLCAVFANTMVIECLKRYCVPYSISKLSIDEALLRLSFEREKTQESWRIVKEERKRIIKELKNFPWIAKVFPSDTNFICIELPEFSAFHTYLLKKGILIEKADHIIPHGLRITIGTPCENDALLKELRCFFGSF